MKRVVSIGFLLVIIFLVCLTVFSNFEDHSTPAMYEYTGKVLLGDEDYKKLKHELAQPEVVIEALDVYSSEEHLVNFQVYVPADVSFSFGEVDYTFWEHTVVWDLSTALAIASLIGIFGIACSYGN